MYATVSAGTDRQVKVWSRDSMDHRLLRTLPGHADSIWALTSLPSSPSLVTASDDKTVKVFCFLSWSLFLSSLTLAQLNLCSLQVWDLRGWCCTQTLSYRAKLLSLAVDDNHLYAGNPTCVGRIAQKTRTTCNTRHVFFLPVLVH